MGFWSDFAVAWNEVADATFNTIIVDANEQSNKVGLRYQKMLADPNFRNTAEVKRILKMSSKEARKAFGIAEPVQTTAQTTAKKSRKTRNQSQPSN